MKKPPRNTGPPKKLPDGNDPGAKFARLVYATRMRLGYTSMDKLVRQSGGRISHHRLKLTESGVLPGDEDFDALCRLLQMSPAEARARIK